MLKITNSANTDLNSHQNNLHQKFIFVDDIAKVKKLNNSTELCIIKTDFSKSDLKLIKKIKESHLSTDFWVSSENLSKKNVMLANKMKIKTIVPYPFSNKIVNDYFDDKYGVNKNEELVDNNNYSMIANLKVMIVDDNVINIELLEEILSKFQLNISSFSKPKEAYQALLTEKFDLFLLDIMMPEMSGFELTQKIKDVPHNQNAPIIFISALSDSHTKIKGYDLGSYAYIEKPFDINVIKSQIFNILKNQKAKEAIDTKKEDFLATVTHDLKTPISAGINALNLLLNKNLGELKADQHEIVEDILDSTKFMQDMVENILCRNKIERNSITLSKQIYLLQELTEHCIELTKYILIPKKQKIELQCDINNSLVPLDFVEIKRAIHNLIANASEHSPVGSKILIKIFKDKDKIGLFVQDYGIGIDIKNQEDIFSQYMSIAQKHKTVGSGLGLYVTKNIIEAHGGEISLESKVGYGTKITFLLPLYDKK